MNTTIFVGNLPAVVSKQDLLDVFSCVGQVVDAKIGLQRGWGELSYCGWVTLGDANSAARAVRYFDGRPLFGAPLVVKPVRRNSSARALCVLH